MFHEMVEKKDVSLIPVYYHPDFLMYTNGKVMDYDEMLRSHREIYATPITYSIRFDADTMLEQGDKVASRVYITTCKPGETPHEIEVILIAQYKDDKIFRVWELTFPDWTSMSAFQYE